MATPTATSPSSTHSPTPAAASSEMPKRDTSLIPASRIRQTGERMQSIVANAIFGAAARRRARYSDASAIVTRRRGESQPSGAGSSSESSSLSRKSVVTPNRRLICTTLSISGTDCAPSHLLTDWRVTPSCSASSSCDQPAFLRRAVILSANIIREVLRFRRTRRLFDGQSIPLFAVADKKDGQEICQSTVARRAENGSARSFFRNGSPWASICGTYSKGERRCW